MAGNRRRLGDDRFYSPPPMRKQQKMKANKSRIEPESRPESDDGASSTTSFSSSIPIENLTNFDRFLEHTTPKVPPQFFPKTIMRGKRNLDNDPHPYFILGDLWESFGEWSAYGAGVPLVLNQSDYVIQYYVPYLSGIQLYIDPSRPSIKQRRPGEDSDGDSLKETSSDDSSEYGAGDSRVANKVHGSRNQQNIIGSTIDGMKHLSLKKDPFAESSGDENEMGNSPGLLVFEYFERNQPYGREPLADKISGLASKFPELKTYKSCDLTAASWISVAWYPIYRIPTGPTLQNLDACFLTYHSLSTPSGVPRADWPQQHGTTTSRGIVDAGMSAKLPLPTFGLASYKFQVSFWFPDGVNECQKVNSLSRAADNWLRLLQVNHPDYSFFVSHNSYRR
ncbi:uncharacterized protein LOC132626661 [Lycium barbarum]|uniref:uncharacterized protein LOC132626661 n=1 Tax=Lycium barbarum TaxID=112863 RepID=UPI00293E3B2C|nr:uncharacterized protein LOC132626661 [Lycium barbarum]